MDYSPLVSAVDVTTLLAAIGAVAAIKILPNVTKWGYTKLISWFR